MNCPKCGAMIPRVNVITAFNVAICPNFRCENIVNYKPGNEPRFEVEKFKVPPDIEIQEENGRLNMKIRVKSAKNETLGCLFLLLLVVLTIQVLLPLPPIEDTLEFLVLGFLRIILMTPVILFGLYVIRTPDKGSFDELTVTPKMIQARRYSWLEVERTNIKGIYVRYYLKKDAAQATYQLWGMGRRLKLRWGLLHDLREDQAIYIAQVTKNFLDPYNDEKEKGKRDF